jgi:hypothetical protein
VLLLLETFLPLYPALGACLTTVMSEVTTAKTKDTKDDKPRKSISEIIEESNAKRRAKRRKEGPQPWIVLKFAVFLTSAIIVYACYVYIGRFVVPMLKRSPTALAGRSTGSVSAFGNY